MRLTSGKASFHALLPGSENKCTGRGHRKWRFPSPPIKETWRKELLSWLTNCLVVCCERECFCCWFHISVSFCECVYECEEGIRRKRLRDIPGLPRGRATHYAMRIDWMIWKIAEPHTTKMNSASSHGPTGYFSSAFFVDLGTFPRWVMLRLAFSLAMRILCCGAIVLCLFR